MVGKWEIQNAISEDCPYEMCDGKGNILLKNTNPDDTDPKDYYGLPIKEVVRVCKCKDGRVASKALKDAKMPSEYTNITLRSFKTDIYGSDLNNEIAGTAKKIATNYVKEFPSFFSMGKGLYIYSETKGSGKTRLSASIANAILRVWKDKQYKIHYIRSVDLVTNIKNTFDKRDISTKDVLDEVKNVDILILDDFGVEKVSDYMEEQLTNILDYRYANKKVTIFNSNIDINRLNTKYTDGRLQSRVKKMVVTVLMPEVDIRTDEAEQEETELMQRLLK